MLLLEVTEESLKNCISQHPQLFETIALSVDESTWLSWQEKRQSLGVRSIKCEYTTTSQSTYPIAPFRIKQEQENLPCTFYGQHYPPHSESFGAKRSLPYIDSFQSSKHQKTSASGSASDKSQPLEYDSFSGENIDITNLSHEVSFVPVTEQGATDVLREMNKMMENLGENISTNEVTTPVSSRQGTETSDTQDNSNSAQEVSSQDPHVDSTGTLTSRSVEETRNNQQPGQDIDNQGLPGSEKHLSSDYSSIYKSQSVDISPGSNFNVAAIKSEPQISDVKSETTRNDGVTGYGNMGISGMASPRLSSIVKSSRDGAVIELSSDEETESSEKHRRQNIASLPSPFTKNSSTFGPPPMELVRIPYSGQHGQPFQFPIPQNYQGHNPLPQFALQQQMSRMPSFNQSVAHMQTHPVTSPKMSNKTKPAASPAKKTPNKKSQTSVRGADGLIKCSVCNRGFTHKADLQTHMVIHTGKQGRERAIKMAQKILLIKGPLITQRQAQRSITNIQLTAVELTNIMKNLEDEGYGRLVKANKARTFFCKNHPDTMDIEALKKLEVNPDVYKETFLTMSCTDMTYLELVKQYHHQSHMIFH